jgi:hypothetical protein
VTFNRYAEYPVNESYDWRHGVVESNGMSSVNNPEQQSRPRRLR